MLLRSLKHLVRGCFVFAGALLILAFNEFQGLPFRGDISEYLTGVRSKIGEVLTQDPAVVTLIGVLFLTIGILWWAFDLLRSRRSSVVMKYSARKNTVRPKRGGIFAASNDGGAYTQFTVDVENRRRFPVSGLEVTCQPWIGSQRGETSIQLPALNNVGPAELSMLHPRQSVRFVVANVKLQVGQANNRFNPPVQIGGIDPDQDPDEQRYVFSNPSKIEVTVSCRDVVPETALFQMSRDDFGSPHMRRLN